VLVVDKLTYAGDRRSLAACEGKPGFAFLRADIADADAMAAAFRDFRPEAVMHLAAESHVDRSIAGAAPFVRTNVDGTFVLLEAARAHWAALDAAGRGRFRFLHVSTDEVFGSLGPEDRAFDEATPYDPRSPYSATKAASDHLARAWHHTHGLPVLVTNCSNNYGPFHFPEKLIPLVLLNALEGKPLPVYGDGGNVRDWLFVEDHARALVAALERGRPGETYCVGGRSEKRNLEVVEAICDALDERRPAARPRRELIRFVPDRPGHDRRYAIDPSKAERELDWRARESFESGLARTADWYLQNDWWWRPLREQRYAGERLGLPGADGKGEER
jgi:dTDP-glucose 4,6-dehydratase